MIHPGQRWGRGGTAVLRCAALLCAASLSAALGACTSGAIPVAQSAGDDSAQGALAPDFTARDHRGETVVLSEVARPNTITVLIFYRGSW